jgi:hypothetical protein
MANSLIWGFHVCLTLGIIPDPNSFAVVSIHVTTLGVVADKELAAGHLFSPVNCRQHSSIVRDSAPSKR